MDLKAYFYFHNVSFVLQLFVCVFWICFDKCLHLLDSFYKSMYAAYKNIFNFTISEKERGDTNIDGDAHEDEVNDIVVFEHDELKQHKGEQPSSKRRLDKALEEELSRQTILDMQTQDYYDDIQAQVQVEANMAKVAGSWLGSIMAEELKNKEVERLKLEVKM
ncbi:hypothetical protein L1987_33058 [Smallanthus sonchifolius]|uniref:Uncharacterized protein n=1 Tax=Smallanthus sonchifolius TaxID=185202 RepID=A0ACB9HRP7_9ASTR|nr:hypothetical protein L1987_33058 [Smallanthus sonchifolius]